MKQDQDQQQKLPQLKGQFIKMTQISKIPKEYVSSFFKMLEKKVIEVKKQLINQEIYKVSYGKSAPQLIDKTLEERQQLLKELRKALIDARVSKSSLNLPYICTLLEEVRELSLRIIEQIASGRNRLQISAAEDVYGNAVIRKLSTDIDFLRVSPLRKYIQFANSNDPLFMYPTRKFWGLSLTSSYNNRAVINFFQLSQSMRSRLEHADQFIKSGISSIVIQMPISNYLEPRVKSKVKLLPALDNRRYKTRAKTQAQDYNDIGVLLSSYINVKKRQKRKSLNLGSLNDLKNHHIMVKVHGVQQDRLRSLKKAQKSSNQLHSLTKGKTQKFFTEAEETPKNSIHYDLEKLTNKKEDLEQKQYPQIYKFERENKNEEKQIKLAEPRGKFERSSQKFQSNMYVLKQKQSKNASRVRMDLKNMKKLESQQQQMENEQKPSNVNYLQAINELKKELTMAQEKEKRNKYTIVLENLTNWRQLKNFDYGNTQGCEVYEKIQEEINQDKYKSGRKISPYHSNKQNRSESKENKKNLQLPQNSQYQQISEDIIDKHNPIEKMQNKSNNDQKSNIKRGEIKRQKQESDKGQKIKSNNPNNSQQVSNLHEDSKIIDSQQQKNQPHQSPAVNQNQLQSQNLINNKSLNQVNQIVQNSPSSVPQVQLAQKSPNSNQEPKVKQNYFVPPPNSQITIQSVSLSSQNMNKFLQETFNYDIKNLDQYFNCAYFKNRQILLIVGKIQKTNLLISVLHPIITDKKRLVLILFMQTIKNLQPKFAKSLLLTAVKYIFLADPAQIAYFLINKNITSKQTIQSIKSFKYCKGLVKCPLSLPFLEPQAFVLNKQELVCKKQENYFDLLNAEMYVAGGFQLPVIFSNGDIAISETFMQNIKKEKDAARAEKDYQQFANLQQMRKYLQDEQLEEVTDIQINDKISLMVQSFSQIFKQVRFCVYESLIYITVQPPHSYYYESQEYFYLFIKAQKSNHYFVISDSQFEDDQSHKTIAHFAQQFRTKIEGKKKGIILKPSIQEIIISIPLFQRSVSVKVNRTQTVNLHCRIAWTEYIKGARQVQADKAGISQVLSPFFFGLVEINKEDKIQYSYFCKIEKKHELHS